MDIFGIDPIAIIVIVTVSGVALQNVFGWLKNGSESFDPRQAAASAIIAIFAGIALVGTTVNNLPEGIPDIELFLILVGQIGLIAGFDILAKNGIKAAMRSMVKKGK